MSKKYRWDLALLASVLTVGWLLGTAGVAKAEFGNRQINYTEVGGGAFDTPLSKLAPWPNTDGDFFYSGCYAPERCFVTIDISDRLNPTVAAKVHTYDTDNSVPPISSNPVWTNDALFDSLDIKAPCGDWVGVDQEILSPGQLADMATCWDPGWNTHSHFAAFTECTEHPEAPGCNSTPGPRILVVNQERWRGNPNAGKRINYHGLAFYDVADPYNPVFLSRWNAPTNSPHVPDETWGGTHHFFFDGRYVYTGAYYKGFYNRIFVIVDVKNPSNPKEVGKLWIPGQKYTELKQRDWIPQSVFSPIRYAEDPEDGQIKLRKGIGVHWTQVVDDTAVVSWHQAGLVLVDVSNKNNPKFISRLDYLTPEFQAADTDPGAQLDYATCVDENGPWTACGNAHSAKYILDEDNERTGFIWVADEYFNCPYGHLRIVDASDPANLELVAHYFLPGGYTTNCEEDYTRRTPSTHLGNMLDGILHLAWYGAGVQGIDLSNPYSPTFAGAYIYTDTGGGRETYDVIFSPDNQYFYVSDSFEGARVIQYTPGP